MENKQPAPRNSTDLCTTWGAMGIACCMVEVGLGISYLATLVPVGLLKGLFTEAIAGSGAKADGKLDFIRPSSSSSDSSSGVTSPAKKRKAVGSTNEPPRKAVKE